MSGLNEWQKHPDALHVISLGAGRQSSAMYLMAVAGEIEPVPDVAIFADTGNEPPHVYEQLAYLMQARFTDVVPIEVVSNGNIYEDSMAAVSGGSPWGKDRWGGPPVFAEGGGPMRKRCTEKYKIVPLKRHIQKIRDGKPVINWRGHTVDEIHRAKPSKEKYQIVRWPLLELRMSTNDCWWWLEQHRYPEFKWSACEICPFRLRELDKAKILSRSDESWKRIQLFDQELRDLKRFKIDKPCYLNAAYESMDEFIQRDDMSGQMSLFDCDGGACGL